MATMDTGTESLLCDVEDSVATITMNRPEARNAMDSEMMPAMATVLSALELDNDVRCIVVTGAGKGFCSGTDLKERKEGDESER